MFLVHRTYDLSNGVKGKTLAVFNTAYGIAVMYHKTVVVQTDADMSKVTLQNGGWDTVSTSFVINTALKQIPGFRLYRVLKKHGRLEIYVNGKRTNKYVTNEPIELRKIRE